MVQIRSLRTNMVLFWIPMNHRDPDIPQKRTCAAAFAPTWGALAQFLLAACR